MAFCGMVSVSSNTSEEMLPPGLDTPNHFDALQVTWQFTPTASFTTTYQEAT